MKKTSNRSSARTASYRFDINDLVVSLSADFDITGFSVDWQCGRHSTTTPLIPLSRRRYRIDQALTLVCSIRRNRSRLATLTLNELDRNRSFGRVEIDLADLCRVSSQPFVTRDYRLNDCVDADATMTIRITTESLVDDGDKFSVDGDFAIELQQQLQEEKRIKQDLIAQVDDLTARLFQETLRYEEILKKTASEQQTQVASLSQSSEGEIRLLRTRLLDQKVRLEARVQDEARRIRDEEEAKSRDLLRLQMEKFQEKIIDLESQKRDADTTTSRYREEAERLRKQLNEFAKNKGGNDEHEIVAVKDLKLGRRVLKKGDDDDLKLTSDPRGVDLVLLEKIVQSMKQHQDVLIQKQRARNISEQAKNRAIAVGAQIPPAPSRAAPVAPEVDTKLIALKNELKAAQEEAADQAKKTKLAESGKLMAVKQLELERKWRETLQKQIDGGGGSGAAPAMNSLSGADPAQRPNDEHHDSAEASRKISQLTVRIQELERAESDAVRHLERDVQRLKDELRGAGGGGNDNELEHVRAQLYKAQADADALQQTRDALQGDLRKAQMELEMNVKQVQIEQRWREQLQKQVDEIIRDRAERDSQMGALRLQASAAEQKYAESETVLGQLRMQVADLEKRLDHSRQMTANTAPADIVSAVRKERDLLLDRAELAELRATQIQCQLDRANEDLQELNATIAGLRETNETLTRDLKKAMELSQTTMAKALEMQQSPTSLKAIDRVWERRAKDAEDMLKMAQVSFAETTKILEDRSIMQDEDLVQTRQRLVAISDDLNLKEEQVESLKRKLQDGYKERVDMNEYLNDLEIELANNKARFVDTIDELSNLENENLRLREKLVALGVKVTPPQRSQPRFTQSPELP